MTRWINLEGIVLSEILYGLTYVEYIYNKNLIETVSDLVLARSEGVGEKEHIGQMVQTSSQKITSGDLMHSMVTIVNKTVLYTGKLLRE